MNENFATKADLKEVGWKLESKIRSLESSLKEMEYRLTIKLGTVMALSIGITTTLVKIIPTTGH